MKLLDALKQLKEDYVRRAATAREILKGYVGTAKGQERIETKKNLYREFSYAVDRLLYDHREELSGWIAVAERLPNQNTPVLCTDGSETTIMRLNDAVMRMGLFWQDLPYENVTHWRPLPAPPTNSSK